MEILDFKKICEICQGDHIVKECQYYDEVVEYNEKEGRKLTEEEKDELQMGAFMGVGLILIGFYFLWDISLLEAILAVMRDMVFMIIELFVEIVGTVIGIINENIIDENRMTELRGEIGKPFIVGFELQFIYFLFCFSLGDILLIAVIREWYKIKKGKNKKEVEKYFTE